MKVSVRFHSRLREIVGKKEVQLELRDGAKLRDLLGALIELYGPTFKEEILDKANKPIVILMLNGKSVSFDAELEDGDIVSIMPPIAGG